MKYRIAIAPGTDESPDFGVIVPDLLGCYSQGDDLEGAVGKAKESVEQACWKRAFPSRSPPIRRNLR